MNSQIAPVPLAAKLNMLILLVIWFFLVSCVEHEWHKLFYFIYTYAWVRMLIHVYVCRVKPCRFYINYIKLWQSHLSLYFPMIQMLAIINPGVHSEPQKCFLFLGSSFVVLATKVFERATSRLPSASRLHIWRNVGTIQFVELTVANEDVWRFMQMPLRLLNM